MKNVLIGVLCVLAIWQHFTHPTTLVFNTKPALTIPSVYSGWTVRCLNVDGKRGVVEPNYAEKACWNDSERKK